MNKTIFVAGVYGVGKDYLCNKISEIIGVKKFSASQLISNINKEIPLKEQTLNENTKIILALIYRDYLMFLLNFVLFLYIAYIKKVL